MYVDFRNQKHSEEFLTNYVKQNDYIFTWDYISEYQVLSEKFIREFKHKVDWYFICKYQKISINFIDEMIQCGLIKSCHTSWLFANKNINKKELRRYFSI